MDGFSIGEAAAIAGLTQPQIRSLVRSGAVIPRRQAGGRLQFAFSDLVLLRTAAALRGAGVAARRVSRVLADMRNALPPEDRMTSLRVASDGQRVVILDDASAWSADSGQLLFEFALSQLPLPKRRERLPSDADAAFDAASEAESRDAEEAIAAYRRVVAIDARHADAHCNLGRLLHEKGDLHAAVRHYRLALRHDPAHATAAFNLGVVLEDQGKASKAVEAYRRAIEIDATLADAHCNLALLLDKSGMKREANLHWKRLHELGRG